MAHYDKRKRDANAIPDANEHLPEGHPLRRRDDVARAERDLAGRIHLGTRPVDFTRPLSVEARREQVAREAALRKVNAHRRKPLSDSALILGFVLAALALLAVMGVAYLMNLWWPVEVGP